MDTTPPPTRRPIAVRNTAWATTIARWLTRVGLRPNQISILSVVFAALSGAALWYAGSATGSLRTWLFVSAAVCIQLRLLCNMFDGMVAVEGGLRSKSGEIYNELPDRFSDALSLVGASYALAHPAWFTTMGWAAALLAVVTAYARTLGVAAGASQQFIGPMAKQQRMFLLTFGCLVTPFEVALGRPPQILPVIMVAIVIGCGITIVRRVTRILADLESR